MIQTLTHEEARERAERGYDFLTQHYAVEAEWALKIDLQMLSLHGCDTCVLGQLNDAYQGLSYSNTAVALGLRNPQYGDVDHERAVALGFNLSKEHTTVDWNIEGDNDIRVRNWYTLTQAWRDVIIERTGVPT